MSEIFTLEVKRERRKQDTAAEVAAFLRANMDPKQHPGFLAATMHSAARWLETGKNPEEPGK